MKNNRYFVGLSRMFIPALVIIAVALSAFVPVGVAFADEGAPGGKGGIDERLENCYEKLQEWYGIQDNNIGRAQNLLDRIEELLVKADELGIDASEVEALLPSMIDALQQAEVAHAEADAILKRFTKKQPQHPTYSALAELGKVIKTIFLCHYLASEELRREIYEGLNVIENWNSTNDFILYGKGGVLNHFIVILFD